MGFSTATYVTLAAYYDWKAAGPNAGSCLHHWSNGINSLTKMWNDEFPRFAELRRHLLREAYHGWFSTVPSRAFLSGVPRDAYQRREAELGALSNPAWQNLKNKVLSSCNSTRKELISILNEAAGYCRLQQVLSERAIAFDDIFEPDIKSSKPEWQAVHDEQPIAALELKTIFPSDEQEKQIERDAQRVREGKPRRIKRADTTIPQGFWNKLDGHIAKAKKQLRRVAAGRDIPRIAHIIMSLDVEIDLDFERNRKIISEYCAGKCDDVEVIPDFRWGV